MTSGQLDLLSVEPAQGRTRHHDPAPSVTAAKRAPVRTQRRVIAAALTCRPYVTADWLADNDHLNQSHRSVWSTRLGGMVRDGLLEKAGTVPGPSQQVTAYQFTAKGRAWASELLSETRAA